MARRLKHRLETTPLLAKLIDDFLKGDFAGDMRGAVVSTPQAKALWRHANCAHEAAYKEICRKDSLALTDEDRAAVVNAKSIRPLAKRAHVLKCGAASDALDRLSADEAALVNKARAALTPKKATPRWPAGLCARKSPISRGSKDKRIFISETVPKDAFEMLWVKTVSMIRPGTINAP